MLCVEFAQTEIFFKNLVLAWLDLTAAAVVAKVNTCPSAPGTEQT